MSFERLSIIEFRTVTVGPPLQTIWSAPARNMGLIRAGPDPPIPWLVDMRLGLPESSMEMIHTRAADAFAAENAARFLAPLTYVSMG